MIQRAYLLVLGLKLHVINHRGKGFILNPSSLFRSSSNMWLICFELEDYFIALIEVSLQILSNDLSWFRSTLGKAFILQDIFNHL